MGDLAWLIAYLSLTVLMTVRRSLHWPLLWATAVLDVIFLAGSPGYYEGFNAEGAAALGLICLCLFVGPVAGLTARERSRSPPDRRDLLVGALAASGPVGLCAVGLGSLSTSSPLAFHTGLLSGCVGVAALGLLVPGALRGAAWGFALMLAVITLDSMSFAMQLQAATPKGGCLTAGGVPLSGTPMALTVTKPVYWTDGTVWLRWSFHLHGFVAGSGPVRPRLSACPPLAALP